MHSKLLSEKEGILPALESSHALAHVIKLAPTLAKDDVILVNLSGRGDKDVHNRCQGDGGGIMSGRGEARLKEVFEAAKKENRSAFMPYLSGGDPSLEATEKLLRAYEEAGADLVEFGVPFSDPIADGPTIQSAGDRAIAAGGTLESLMNLLAKMRGEGFGLPAVLMSYYNPMYVMGVGSICGEGGEFRRGWTYCAGFAS